MGAGRIWSPHGAKLAAPEKGFAQFLLFQEKPCGSLRQDGAREVHPLDEWPGRTGRGVAISHLWPMTLGTSLGQGSRMLEGQDGTGGSRL